MKRGLRTRGFTVVEVTIVLTVTSVLLISALLLFSGKQQDVQFNQAINDIQSQVNQVINNVQTGYYSKTTSSDFSCTATISGPNIDTSGTSEQGTNRGCIFIGRAIHFTDTPSTKVYNLVGLRNKWGSADNVTNLLDAQPSVMPGGNIEDRTLQAGLHPTKMFYSIDNSPPSIPTGVVAFVSNFGQATAGGSTTAKIYAIANTSLNPAIDPVPEIDKDIPTIAVNYISSTTSVTICFDGGTRLLGVLTIGSNNRQLTTKLDFINKNPLPPGPLGVACT